jgi:putative ABC transport system permease protein
MNAEELLRVSITSILANRMRSALTILGIVIGVTSVILLVALVSGLQTFITDQISGLGSNIMFVIPGQIGGGRGPGGAQVNRLTLQDAMDLRNGLRDQAEVSAAVSKNSTLKFGNKIDKNVSTLGAESNLPKIIKLIKITQGRFLSTSEGASSKQVAVIGPTVAKNLFGTKNPVGQTITISDVKYQVIGVMASRGSSFGIDQDNTVVIPLAAATRQFGINNPNAIYIGANSPTIVSTVQNKATKILEKRLSEDDFTIQTQAQTLSTISQITGVLTAALGGIAAISLLVGGIGVMNIMLVSVTERTREIGLRKALGAQPKDIRSQFLIEAVVLSGLGGIIGIILGYVLAFIAGRFLTTTVPLWSVGLSFGFSMLVGVIFGVAPAIRASRLDPITALRYE